VWLTSSVLLPALESPRCASCGASTGHHARSGASSRYLLSQFAHHMAWQALAASVAAAKRCSMGRLGGKMRTITDMLLLKTCLLPALSRRLRAFVVPLGVKTRRTCHSMIPSEATTRPSKRIRRCVKAPVQGLDCQRDTSGAVSSTAEPLLLSFGGTSQAKKPVATPRVHHRGRTHCRATLTILPVGRIGTRDPADSTHATNGFDRIKRCSTLWRYALEYGYYQHRSVFVLHLIPPVWYFRVRVTSPVANECGLISPTDEVPVFAINASGGAIAPSVTK